MEKNKKQNPSQKLVIHNQKRLQIAKSILRGREVQEVTILDKIYDRAIVLKTALYWHKSRHVAQWYKIENPNVSAHNHCHLIIEKKKPKIPLEKREHLQQAVLGKQDVYM